MQTVGSIGKVGALLLERQCWSLLESLGLESCAWHTQVMDLLCCLLVCCFAACCAVQPAALFRLDLEDSEDVQMRVLSLISHLW